MADGAESASWSRRRGAALKPGESAVRRAGLGSTAAAAWWQQRGDGEALKAGRGRAPWRARLSPRRRRGASAEPSRGTARTIRGRAHSSAVLMARPRQGSSAVAAGAASARGSSAVAWACALEHTTHAASTERGGKGERGRG